MDILGNLSAAEQAELEQEGKEEERNRCVGLLSAVLLLLL
jgi:hypothetical protein